MMNKWRYLWIALLGSLIGISETLIGNTGIPYRSVVLSSITLAFLSMGRSFFPKKGISVLLVIIALLFKINSLGINSCCTVNAFLCGPTALLLLGFGHEIFYDVFIAQKPSGYLNTMVTCACTAIAVFSVYAIIQTYILHAWDTSRLIQYVFLRGSSTALISGVLSLALLYLIKPVRNIHSVKLNPYLYPGILTTLIIALWVIGSFA